MQVVEIVDNEAAKWTWLSERADEYVAEGKVLIFVLSKVGVEEIAASLRRYCTLPAGRQRLLTLQA